MCIRDRDYTVDEKATAVEKFINESLNTIDASKDVVDMVQVGNETTAVSYTHLFDRLTEIGFVFDPHDTECNRRLDQYKRYIKQTGTTYISKRTDFEGEHLGAWVQTQKHR